MLLHLYLWIWGEEKALLTIPFLKAHGQNHIYLFIHSFILKFINRKMFFTRNNFKKKIRFYLFTFRGGEGERGRETSVCERYICCLPLAHPQLGTRPGTQACALTRNRTGDLSQAGAQSTEPHRPWQNYN